MVALPHARRRATLEAWLETDLRSRFHGRVLSIDDRVADRWGLLTAQALKSGIVLPVIDGLLAATALQHNLTFVTRDTGSIAAAGVAVFNPSRLVSPDQLRTANGGRPKKSVSCQRAIS